MTTSEIIAVIGYVVPLIITGAILVYHKFYAALPANQQQTVGELAKIVVPSVEQSMGMLVGAAKKQEATRIIEVILASVGVKGVPPELIDAAIEAVVYSLHQNTMTASTQRLPNVK